MFKGKLDVIGKMNVEGRAMFGAFIDCKQDAETMVDMRDLWGEHVVVSPAQKAELAATDSQQPLNAIALLKEWLAMEFNPVPLIDEAYGSLLRRTDAVIAQQQ